MENRSDLLKKAAEGLRALVQLLENEIVGQGDDCVQDDLPGFETEEEAKEPVTFEQVQKYLIEKSRGGFRNEVQTMLAKHGARKLSDIKDDEKRLRSLLEDAEKYCREITKDEIVAAAKHVAVRRTEKGLSNLLAFFFANSVDELPKSSYAGFLWEAGRM